MRYILILLFFLTLVFTTAANEVVVIQGQITEVCSLPDPHQAPYEDCDYAVKFVYTANSKQREAVIIMPGFRARKMCPEADYIQSHKGFYELTLCDFWDAPEIDQSRQVVNNFGAEIEEVFFLRKIRKIDSLSANANYSRDNSEASVGIKMHPQHTPKSVAKRQASIASDLKYLDELFMRHGGSLASWEQELSPVWKSFENPQQQGLLKVGEVFVTQLRYNFKSRTQPISKTYGKTAAEALIQLNQLLKKYNIDLIVVPFPDGYDMAFEYFCRVKSSDGFTKPKDLAFIRYLLQNDVEAINLYPALLAEQKKHRYFYNYPDFHPNCFSYTIAADLIAKRLQRYSYDHLTDELKPTIVPTRKKLTVDGISEEIPIFSVNLPKKKEVSPYFLLIGDSFMNGAYPYIVKKLLFYPEKYYRNGGAFDIFRYLTNHSKGIELLTSRPVCVFIFDLEHLQRSWCNIPSEFPAAEEKSVGLPATVKMENLEREADRFIMHIDPQTSSQSGVLEIPDAENIRSLSFYIEQGIIGTIKIKVTAITSTGDEKDLGTAVSRGGPDKIDTVIPADTKKIRIDLYVYDHRNTKQKKFSMEVFSRHI